MDIKDELIQKYQEVESEYKARIAELEEQLNSARLQINGVETIEIFMNGKKTVFVKEELVPTKEEAEKIIDLITNIYVENYNDVYRKIAQSGFAKLQKIAGQEVKQ